MVLYFGYASCPDVCPLDLQTMADALEDISDETRARVQLGRLGIPACTRLVAACP